MILVNGQPADQLPVSDRGLQYGDGLFETMLASQGKIAFWEPHYNRLLQGCDRLKIPCPERYLLEKEIQILLSDAAESTVVKLIVTRGSGGRGYQPPAEITPTRILSLHEKPGYPKKNSTIGIKLHLCETRLGLNPHLAGVKHLNRLEQVLARNEWQDESFAEGLMLDMHEHPVEGTMTNIFWFHEGQLCTPSLQYCGVEGVMRSQIIRVAENIELPVAIKQYTVDDILNSDALFVSNSVLGIWPVKQFLSQQWSPHPMTETLQNKTAVLA